MPPPSEGKCPKKTTNNNYYKRLQIKQGDEGARSEQERNTPRG